MSSPFQPLPCGSGDTGDQECCPEPELLCDVQPDNSIVQFIRTYTGTPGGGGGSLTTSDHLLDGSVYVPTGTVRDCDPYTTCTPSPNIDLAADCGPGEPVTQQILLDDVSAPLANSVFNDDATADPLCGGQWDRPADELNAPFPVNESFRNTTFDEPGPVLQGTAPYPDLTADVDGAGAGWLQVADINSGTNGLWQVPSPFPTSEGMNAGITFASHDGTTPGGDGMAFVFTDGSVPAQSIPVGGFGNLGLQNWQGGYVAVVLDEYGQTCTCSQAAQGVIDPNPGPCGFCGNTISIQLAGAARQGASCACCTVASMSVAPKALNQTTRSTPARLLTSIIEEGGQTFVSASVDWNDGNGPIQYFQRVNVTACAGPPPATLRMAAYGGSGGSFRAVKEMRDAVARPAGVSNWRSFPITTDPVPACATLITVTGDVDVTFTADDQTTGNNNPEAYFWLVNTVTGAVLDRDVVSSLPSQVGQVQHLSITADVAPADLPNLRLYVGAESRDENGEYSSLWENLDIGATATGCPADPVRTLAISAPCPIPVTIVGGSDDGGGGGTTVFNAPSTFEDAPVCMTVAGETSPGFRREVRAPDGNIEVSFLGVDGLPATPDTWTPGACPGAAQTLGPVCYTIGGPGGSQTGFLTLDGNGDPVLYDAVGEVVPAGTYTIVICPLLTQQSHVLCDQGNGGQPFLRWYVDSPVLGFPDQQWDFELDGSTPYVPVGPVGVCGATDTADREVVCWTQTSTGDEIHTGTIRHDDSLPAPGWLLFDQHQTLVSPAEPGLTFVPCSECGTASSIGTVCYTPPVGVQTLQDDWAGATSVAGGGSRVWTNSNFAGQGITVTETVTPDTGAALLANGVRNTATSPASEHTAIDLGAPRTNVTVRMDFFGSGQGERLRNVTPAFTAVSGNGTAVLANTGVDGGPAADGTIFLLFAGPVQNISWDYAPTGGGLSGQSFISFNTGNASNSAPAAVLRDCATGATTFVDLATGTVLDPLAISIVDCPGDIASTTTIADSEQEILCDSTPTRFIRTYLHDATGAITATINTTLAGAPFVPVGAVGVCTTTIATDLDFDQVILCDSAGTAFIRRFTFSSATGAVTATTNLTLAGAAFVPVGTVGVCSDCCPTVVADELCTNTGSGFGTAIRSTTGTVTLIDSVTGAAILAANIVACPSVNTVITASAEARLIADADAPWTPGADVTGVLTGVTLTVLSGTANLIDASGTVLNGLPAGLTLVWNVEDHDVLTGPQSIDAIGGQTVVNWTRR